MTENKNENAKSPSHVYAVAYACQPGKGSEEGVGWAIARALLKYSAEFRVPVTIVTASPNSAGVRTGLASLSSPGAVFDVLSVPMPRKAMKFRSEWLLRIAYCCWQVFAVRAIERRLVELADLDTEPGRRPVVHHVSYATEAIPNFEGRLQKYAAWVLGPVGSAARLGGQLRVPLSFRVRRFVRDQLVGQNLAADLLIATNDSTLIKWKILRSRSSGRACVVEPNILIDRMDLPPSKPRDAREFDVAIAGVLSQRKSVDVALKALAMTGRSLRVAIIGDGPERPVLERLACESPDLRVEFMGRLPRISTLSVLANSKLLLHPAIQEGSPWVVGEAQSVATPPIVWAGAGGDTVVRLGGLGEIVMNPSVSDLARAIVKVLDAGEEPQATSRWLIDRMPVLLDEWYRRALTNTD